MASDPVCALVLLALGIEAFPWPAPFRHQASVRSVSMVQLREFSQVLEMASVEEIRNGRRALPQCCTTKTTPDHLYESTYWQPHKDGMVLAVRVTPKAARTRIVGYVRAAENHLNAPAEAGQRRTARLLRRRMAFPERLAILGRNVPVETDLVPRNETTSDPPRGNRSRVNRRPPGRGR